MVQFFPDAVYAVMMVEKDANKDISGDALTTYKTNCDNTWKLTLATQQFSGKPPTSAAAKAAGFEAIKGQLLGLNKVFIETWPVGDDDLIGLIQRLMITPGQTPVLKFKGTGSGAGGKYEVTFKVASP